MIDKHELIEYLGKNCTEAARKLGYTHRNNIQRLSNPLTPNQEKTILMRMRAFGVKVPKKWEE